MTPPSRRYLSTGLVVAAGSVALITGVIYALREIAPVLSTGVVYMLAVLLVSSYWGFWLGPRHRRARARWRSTSSTSRRPAAFTIAESENWVALAVFLVAAVVTSTLAGAAALARRRPSAARREADLSAEMARLLLGGAGVGGVAAGGGAAHRQGLRPPLGGDRARLGGQRRAPAGAPSDRGRQPHRDGARPGGHRARGPRRAPGPRRPGLETLVAAVRRREELESQVIETKALRRSQRGQDDAAALGLARPALAAHRDHRRRRRPRLGHAVRARRGDELTSVIAAESARLSRLVDNLLDLARLQAGGIEPRQDWMRAWTR